MLRLIVSAMETHTVSNVVIKTDIFAPPPAPRNKTSAIDLKL